MLFRSMGNRIQGHFIRKIEDYNGNVLYKYNENIDNILNKSLVFILNEMLTYTYDKDFINYNFPTMISLAPKISNKYSIKSGTTNTDSWIIGYNKNAVLGIWSGYDDNKFINSETSIKNKDTWISVMENYSSDKDNSWYTIPNNVVGVLVNPITGEVIKGNEKDGKIFYFLKGTEPFNDFTYDLDSVFREEKLE